MAAGRRRRPPQLRDPHDGTLWCWGDNSDGQIGDGTTDPRPTPTQVATPAGSDPAGTASAGTALTWLTVATGDHHSCAIRDDGTLWCWGDNANGQLGDSTTDSRTTPTQVATPTGTHPAGTDGAGATPAGTDPAGTHPAETDAAGATPPAPPPPGRPCPPD
jgi:hypothetical protein